jgi:antitoxin MazE
MKVSAKIQKWGNGLALRVSGVMRDIPDFQEGTEVVIDVNETGFSVVKSIRKETSIFPFSESQLVQGLNDGQMRADLLAVPLPSEIEL